MQGISYSSLSAYTGNEPYIFVSYAHKDSETVLPIIQAMQQAGYRIWFDAGIEAGTEWSNNIAAHLQNCSAVLFFASEHSVVSENCLDELAYAKSHQKPALLVFTNESVTLPVGAEMQSARYQRMYLNRQSSLAEFVKNLSGAAMLNDCCNAAAATPTIPVAPPPAFVPPAPAIPAVPVMPTVPVMPAGPVPAAFVPSAPKKSAPVGVIVGAAVAVVAAIAVVCVLLFAGNNRPAVQGPTGNPTDGVTGDVTPGVSVELSDSLEDYTFRLEGTVYQLPFAFTQLTQKGWTVYGADYASQTLVGGLADGWITLVKDGKELDVCVANPSGNAATVSECPILGVRAEARRGLDFCVAGEIRPQSTVSEIESAFGVPTSRNTQSDYERLSYENEDTGSGTKFFRYIGDMEEYSYIELVNWAISPEKTETNETMPAYLAQYKAPTALGTDLTKGHFAVDGKVYALPMPLKTLTADGWQISSGDTAVVAGGQSDLTLTKDGKKFSVTVQNRATYQTTPQNCEVIGISAYSGSNVATITFPGNIRLGMSARDIRSRAAALSESELTYSTTFSYSEYETRTYSIYLSVDKETDQLTSMTLKNYVEGMITE